jgi:hypothetical protein
MIEVNLLPAELRVAERIVWSRLAIVGGGVAIILTQVFLLAAMILLKLNPINKAIETRQDIIDSQEIRLAEIERERQRNAEIRQQLEELAGIVKTRRLWAPILYSIAVRMPDGVWVIDLQVREGDHSDVLILTSQASAPQDLAHDQALLQEKIMQSAFQFWLNLQAKEFEGDQTSLKEIFHSPGIDNIRVTTVQVRGTVPGDVRQLHVGSFKVSMPFIPKQAEVEPENG